MTQGSKSQLLPAHYRILDQIKVDPDKQLTKSELGELERDYRWAAPGVSDDPSMIDFFDTPRSTLFEGVVRLWLCAYLAALHSKILDQAVSVEIVDVGAGRGEVARILGSMRLMKGARFKYTAIDIDIRKRELFQKLYPTGKHEYLIHDFREGLPLGDGSVDAIVNTETIEHVTEDEGRKFLADALKALKPGGVLVLTTPNASARKRAISIYHAFEWPDDYLKEAVTDVGFEIDQWFYLGVPMRKLDPPKDWKKRMHSDLLRAVLGPASGEEGNVIFAILRKPS